MPQVFHLAALALAPVILLTWLKLAGTYSPLRDAVGIALVTLVFVALQARRRNILQSPAAWGRCADQLHGDWDENP